MFRNHKKRPCVCHVAGERIATLEVGGMVWICLRPSQDPNWELYNVCTSENQHGTPQWRFGRWLPFKRVLFGFHVNQFSGRIQKTWCQLTFEIHRNVQKLVMWVVFLGRNPSILKDRMWGCHFTQKCESLATFFFSTKTIRWVFPKKGVPQNGWFMMENPI